MANSKQERKRGSLEEAKLTSHQHPVDLKNFRELTGGDTQLEAELFDEFILSFRGGLERMQMNLNDPAEWRRQSHVLKGLSLNLGASKLSELCKIGQDEYECSCMDKEKLLKEIAVEFQEVKRYLAMIS